MASAGFRATVRPSGRGGGGHLVEVPDDAVAALGGKGRIPVRATFNGVPYRGSIVTMGGVTMLGVTKAVLAQAGAGPGDALDVVVEKDDAPREVEVPPELAPALRGNRAATAAWEKLSSTHKREYVNAIASAKKEDTKTRRVDTAIEELEPRSRG